MRPSEAEARLRAALDRRGAASNDFDLNPDAPLPADRVLRPAAVLVAVDLSGPGARLILTKRSARLRHHPGQIAFPGGKIDKGDAGPVAAALREAQEEIGLLPAQVEPLGLLPPHETVTAFSVTPVLALVRHGFDPVPDQGEVEEVFSIPLSHALDPARFRIEGRPWQEKRRNFYVLPYGPYYIWGATARILRALAALSA